MLLRFADVSAANMLAGYWTFDEPSGTTFADSSGNNNTGTITGSLGYTPAAGDAFTIVSNASGSAVNGTFAGRPEGATFTSGSTSLRITYAGGRSGRDIVLTAVAAAAISAPNAGAPNNGTFGEAISAPNAGAPNNGTFGEGRFLIALGVIALLLGRVRRRRRDAQQ